MLGGLTRASGYYAQVKASFARAEQLNPPLAAHTVRLAYGEMPFMDVLASVLERRQVGAVASAKSAADSKEQCAATRAARDVLLLRGEEDAAAALDQSLSPALLAELQPPLYVEPQPA